MTCSHCHSPKVAKNEVKKRVVKTSSANTVEGNFNVNIFIMLPKVTKYWPL